MQLVSFRRGGRVSYGIHRNGGIIDLGPRLGSRFGNVRDVLAAGGLEEVRKAAEKATPDFAATEIDFLPPVLGPEKILCVGINYPNRNEEYKDAAAAQERPSIFTRTAASLVGHGAPILRPPESVQLDYEGEVAIVIGKGGRRIPRAQACSHIAGLTCLNEGSVRDWMRHGKFNVTQGKNFDKSGSIGPWMITADEFTNYSDLHVKTTVNGEVRQSDSTANLIFPFDYLISYVSTFSELKPGDIIATGTPAGAGARFEPPRWLKPGDVVEITITGIGILSNVVADDV